MKINVTIVDYLQPKANLPKEGDIILLMHKNHYSVIKTYQECVRHILHDQGNMIYCFEHQQWSSDKKKC
jgi:hypothetical protein